jgi:hypothetical protein
VKPRLTYANIAATLALFFAVSGTAIAGAQAMISSRDVVDHSLTGIDIANHSLTGTDIKPGSLGSGVFSDAALANLKGADGMAGADGAAGADGTAGAPGLAGTAGSQGPAGQGVATITATGEDVSNYQNLAPLATATLSKPDDYVIFATIQAHNTGTADDNLGCAIFSGDNPVGGGDVSVAAGETGTNLQVGVLPAGAPQTSTPQTVTLKCQSSGATTFDLSKITMRVHDLG